MGAMEKAWKSWNGKWSCMDLKYRLHKLLSYLPRRCHHWDTHGTYPKPIRSHGQEDSGKAHLSAENDIRYGNRYPNSFMDIWYLDDSGVKRPTIIYFHGGSTLHLKSFNNLPIYPPLFLTSSVFIGFLTRISCYFLISTPFNPAYLLIWQMQKFLFFMPLLPGSVSRESCLHDDFDDFIEVTEGYTFELGVLSH